MSDDDPAYFPENCYAILEVVFLHCRRIRTISLHGFDLGDDPDFISPSIKEGFSRLIMLEFNRCIDDIPMFINQTPIPNIQTIKCHSDAEEHVDYAVVNTIASNYLSLVNFNLDYCCASSSNILKIVECCPGVEWLAFTPLGPSDLKRSDIVFFTFKPPGNRR
jgi:hypothetical protein